MTPIPHKLSGWCEEAGAALADALEGDEAELARQVDAGQAELMRWETRDGDCWMIHRIDTLTDQPPELLLCCIQGRGARHVLPVVIDAARRQGIAGVRFLSGRRGAARFARRWGFTETARMYYLPLDQVADYEQ
jgi:hypothetical protein